jgi:hypothetical protein
VRVRLVEARRDEYTRDKASRLNGDVRREALSRVYAELCDCLRRGKMFGADA